MMAGLCAAAQCLSCSRPQGANQPGDRQGDCLVHVLDEAEMAVFELNPTSPTRSSRRFYGASHKST